MTPLFFVLFAGFLVYSTEGARCELMPKPKVRQVTKCWSEVNGTDMGLD